MPLEKEEQRLQKIVNWFKEKAIAIKTVEPESGFDDLQFLKPILKNTTLIGLGEATHGTQEFFKMKHRLLEFLVKEMDFKVFAIEAGYAVCFDINNYVLNGIGKKEEVLAGQGYWNWDTEEVLAMIEWIKNYNETVDEKEKVSFWGVDMARLQQPFDIIKPKLMQMDAALANQFDSVVEEAQNSYKKFLDKKLNKKQYALQLEATTANINAVFKKVENNKVQFIEDTSDAAYNSIVDIKRIFEQAWHNRISSFERMEETKPSIEIREKYMAENTLDILNNKEPHKKMVLWAHNVHLAADATAAVNGGLKPMGAYFREALGAAYYSIAFAFNEGSFQAINMNPKDKKLKAFTVGSAEKPAADWVLAQSDFDISFTKLKQTMPTEVDAYLKKEFNYFIVGGGYSDDWERAGEVQKNFANCHDAIIFCQKTNRAVPTEAVKKRMEVE